MAAPDDLDARGELLYGAYLAGVALGATAPAFHHKICHVLGGTFDLVHADAHSVVLPHAVAFNAPALPTEMARLAGALGADGVDPATALWELARRSAVPTRLADLGGRAGPLQRSDLPEAARRVVAERVDNPRPFDEADVLGLLERSFDGVEPSATATDTPNPGHRRVATESLGEP
jgi:maleylacetate reductase